MELFFDNSLTTKISVFT